ncbi:MAG TPA: primase C-terminal domain-containing protein [Bryobacteraceae bacterium]|nr:primase C-terminal domain-containing protein [Bryobacteraceae bacterium]
MFPVEAERLPKSIVELDQWVLWKVDIRAGKPAKVPYATDLRRASTTNPRTWTDFETARQALHANAASFGTGGLGFAFFRDDPYCGIDLDDCLAGGKVKPWAAGIVERFSDTYMEVSPSGAGLKIWARGKIPENVPGVLVGDGAIEMYDHARYFTVTGARFREAPLEIEDHGADLLALHKRLTRGSAGSWPVQPLRGGRIPHGQQHSTLVSIAGTLRARRVCDQAILACLLAINRHQCEKPGPAANIERIVRSTQRWNKENPSRG